MCLHCYQRWISSHNSGQAAFCPLCRCVLPANLAVCLRLKKTIESFYPEASAKRREDVAAQIAAETEILHAPVQTMTPEQQLPTYPQGPYPADLFSQWATAGASQQSLFSAMMVAAHFMGSLRQLGNAHGSEQMPANQPSHGAQQAALSAAGWNGQACSPLSCLAAFPIFSSTAPGSTNPVEGVPIDLATPWTQPRPQKQAWQSAADTATRLEVARAIINTLQSHGWHHSLGPKLADAVRLLELCLYRTADSKAAYCNTSDLEARIVTAVQQRAAAAAARRARLQAAPAAQ